MALDDYAFKYINEYSGDYALKEGLAKKYGFNVFQSKLNAGLYLYLYVGIGWAFGTNITGDQVGLYHLGCEDECPNNCSQSWRFWNRDSGTFIVNKRISVSCENRICCLNLIISSNGQLAKEECPECFGTYRYFTKDENGALIWRLVSSKHRRYLVRNHKSWRWEIHDHYGKINGFNTPYISRRWHDQNFCPEYDQQGFWVYYNNTSGLYHRDISIQVNCVNTNPSLLQPRNIFPKKDDFRLIDGFNYNSLFQKMNEYGDINIK